VDALHGEPGVRSARFLRPDASYPERFAEIFSRLALAPESPRSARLRLRRGRVHDGAVVFDDAAPWRARSRPPAGDAGFGYDPVFYFPPYGRTLAEVSQPGKARGCAQRRGLSRPGAVA
jgi:XTP/dITP diphosphohydrolase